MVDEVFSSGFLGHPAWNTKNYFKEGKSMNLHPFEFNPHVIQKIQG